MSETHQKLRYLESKNTKQWTEREWDEYRETLNMLLEESKRGKTNSRRKS